MENINFILGIIIFQLPGFFTQVVNLIGPKSVAQNKIITLNCTSNEPPIGEYAEILVNEKSHSSVRRYGASCKCGDEETNCKMNSCSCSTDGLWYAINYTCGYIGQYVAFKCVMEFEYGKMVDDIRVDILDIAGPDITTYPKLPVIAGNNVSFKCMVTAMAVSFSITWDCLNFTSSDLLYHNITSSDLSYNNITTYWSEISLFVTSKMDGDICSCAVKTTDFSHAETITVDVESLPILMLEDEILCENVKSVTLVCIVSGELFKYGFKPWTHNINGTFIREIKGHNVRNESAIFIGSCSYQDSGEYTCTAWNEHHGRTFIVNKTTTVHVIGPPVIKESGIEKNLTTKFFVTFYMASKALVWKWYHFNDILPNSTKQLQTILPVYLQLPVYGKMIDFHGYLATIKFQKAQIGKLYFKVKNIYGEAKTQFEQERQAIPEFHFREIILALSGVALFILTTTATAICIRYHGANSNNNHGSVQTRIAIYHAAPKVDNDASLYDVVDVHYDECYNDGTPDNYIDVQYDECFNDGTPDTYLTAVNSDEEPTFSDNDQSPHSYEEIQ